MATLVLFASLVGCGDDAPIRADARPIDGPSAACSDVGSDVYVEGTGDNGTSPEATGRTVTASAPLRLCGQIEVRETGSSDHDRFSFTLAEPSRILVDVTAPDGAAAEQLFGMIFETSGPNDDVPLAVGMLVGGKIVFSAPNCNGPSPACEALVLPARDYELIISPFSFTQQMPTRPFEYRATIRLFDADVACPMPAAVTYTEARDVDPDNDQNDVFDLNGVTTDPDDAPEPSAPALTIGGAGYRIRGVGGLRTAGRDVDTYEILTGPTTNVLDIRVAGAGTSDFDVELNANATVDGLVARGWSPVNPEYVTMAVEPSKIYLLSVYNWDSNTPYDVAICGSQAP